MDLVTKPRSKSIVWLYFGLKADDKGKPLNNREAVCRLCRKIVLAKSGNTTNLRSHLKRRHRADFFDTPSSSSSSGGFENPGLDLNNEEFFEDVPLLQSAPGHSSYVPDAVLPPGEPWLQGGPCRARLSLPSCLSLSGDDSGGSSGEEPPADVKVFAKCVLQQGVMFGPFVGELCRGQTPSSLRYAWAIRDDAAFIYIDASDENKSNWMRYVRYTSSEEKHNLVVFQFYRHIYYRVSQPIAEGAELRVWIGKDYASLLGLGMGDSGKCEVGDKESALRLLQDIQLVTLPEPNGAPLWSDRSQSQSPMPVISDVTTVCAPDGAPASPFPSTSLLPFPSQSMTVKYDFMPGTERLLSNPNASLNSPWYFFGLEPDASGRPLDRSTAVCKLCVEHVGCGGGAADLQNHLVNKHDLRPRDGYKDRSSSTAALQRSLPALSSSSWVSALPVMSSTSVTNAIINFLIMDLQSPDLVEGDGFRRLIHTLLPFNKELPSPDQLENLLKDHHAKAKANLSHPLRGRGDVEDVNDYTAPIEFEPGRRWHVFGNQRDVGQFVTVSVDVWLHSWRGSTSHYLTLWAHFIDCSFTFHNLVLATQRLSEGEESSFQAVESRVKVTAHEWGISQPNLILLGGQWKNRQRRPVQGADAAGSTPHPNSTTFLERDDSASPDDASELGPSGEGLPSIPCFFGAVQGCIEEVMLHPVVSKTLRQFQLFLSDLLLPPAQSKGSYAFPAQSVLQTLTKEEKAGLKSWAHSRPTWNRLYPLLSTLVRHKSVFVDAVKDIKDEVLPPEDLESSSSASCSAISTSNSSSVNVLVSRSDWKVVEDLSLVLRPLDVACRTLAKENFPRLSLVKPILTGLLSRHLISRPADSSSVLKEVKKMMRRHLSSCYENPAVSRALSVACSLDPQFHGLRFMEEKEQKATFDWLKKETVRMVKEDRRRSRGKKRSPSPGSPESDSEFLRRSKRLKESQPISFKEIYGEEEEESDAGDADESEATEPGSQGALSGMEFLLGDLFCSAASSSQSSVEESLDIEMSIFRADRGASLGVEPLQWWRTKAGQFPLLATAARAYLAAPAVAGNAVLDFVEDGSDSRKRSNIPPESLDAMLFLHHNKIPVTESGQTMVAKSEDKSSGT